MKKTFQLNIEGKNRDRVVEAVKHEIRKYVKRERRRELPEGVDYLDFDCQFGPSQEVAAMIHFATITEHIDALVKDGGTQFYIEIVAKDGVRTPRVLTETDVATDASTSRPRASLWARLVDTPRLLASAGLGTVLQKFWEITRDKDGWNAKTVGRAPSPKFFIPARSPYAVQHRSALKARGLAGCGYFE